MSFISKRNLIVVGAGFFVVGGSLGLLWVTSRLQGHLREILYRIEEMQLQISILNELICEKISKPHSEEKDLKDQELIIPQESILPNPKSPLSLSDSQRFYSSSSFNSKKNFNLKDEEEEEEEELFLDTYDGPFPWFSSLDANQIEKEENEEKIKDGEMENKGKKIFFQVDELLEGDEGDHIKAFQVLQALPQQQLENNVEYLWRMAKATYMTSQTNNNNNNNNINNNNYYYNNNKKKLIYEACKYAKKAVDLTTDSSDAYKWYAITLGSTNDYEPIKIKIQNGYKFKELIEKAIELNPEDSSNHYLLGRWCYGVYMMSWIERKTACALFSSPPSASIQQSLQCFLQADRLRNSNWKENSLFISKCYIELKSYSNAHHWLLKARKTPSKTIADKKNDIEIDLLIKTVPYPPF